MFLDRWRKPEYPSTNAIQKDQESNQWPYPTLGTTGSANTLTWHGESLVSFLRNLKYFFSSGQWQTSFCTNYNELAPQTWGSGVDWPDCSADLDHIENAWFIMWSKHSRKQAEVIWRVKTVDEWSALLNLKNLVLIVYNISLRRGWAGAWLNLVHTCLSPAAPHSGTCLPSNYMWHIC